MDYANDVDSAVQVLSKGLEFAEAQRLVCVSHHYSAVTDPQTALHGRTDLGQSTIYPGLEDAHEELTEIFEEMKGQLDKEMKRIAELRKVLEEDPGECRLVRCGLSLTNRYLLYCRYRTCSRGSGRRD
jgi:elongator complex protein 1